MRTLAPAFAHLISSLTHLAPAMGSLSSIAPLAADALANSLCQGTVLAITTWIMLRLLSGISASARFAIWGAVFGFIVLLPLASLHPVRVDAAKSSASLLHLDARWSLAIAAVWIVASTFRLGHLALEALHLRGIWRRAIPLARANDLACAAGGRVQICSSQDINRPSVIGFFSPRILIPTDLAAALSAEQLEQIVLHEVGHLRRRDDWMNLFQKLVLAVMPLNPALAWVERRMCLERELACDDRVLARTRAPRAYAYCLTSLAESRLARRAAALSLGAWGHRSELSRRVESILAGSWRTNPRRVYAAASVAFIVICSGAAVLSRCPQLVAFTSVAASQPTVASFAYGDAPSHAAFSASLQHAALVKATASVSGQGPALVGDGIQLPPRLSPTRKIKRSHPAPPLLRTAAYQERSDPRRLHMHARSFMVFAPPTGGVTAGMILTVGYDGRLTGAAVPTPDGWFLIQL